MRVGVPFLLAPDERYEQQTHLTSVVARATRTKHFAFIFTTCEIKFFICGCMYEWCLDLVMVASSPGVEMSPDGIISQQNFIGLILHLILAARQACISANKRRGLGRSWHACSLVKVSSL
jgi:hypothetical protein